MPGHSEIHSVRYPSIWTYVTVIISVILQGVLREIVSKTRQSSTPAQEPDWRLYPKHFQTILIHMFSFQGKYEVVSKSFRTGHLERELQVVQLSATGCSCIAISWVSPVSFSAITLCVASQRVFIVDVYFFIDSVRKLLDTHSYITPGLTVVSNSVQRRIFGPKCEKI
jgi:hypothetical protein